MTTQKGQVVIDFRSQGLSLAKGSAAHQTLDPLLKEFSEELLEVSLNQLSGRIRTDKFRTFSWSDVNGRGQQVSLKSSGSWNEIGTLEGEVDLVAKKERRQFKIQGTRDRPVFSVYK